MPSKKALQNKCDLTERPVTRPAVQVSSSFENADVPSISGLLERADAMQQAQLKSQFCGIMLTVAIGLCTCREMLVQEVLSNHGFRPSLSEDYKSSNRLNL